MLVEFDFSNPISTKNKQERLISKWLDHNVIPEFQNQGIVVKGKFL